MTPVLQARDLTKVYRTGSSLSLRRGPGVRAVDGVSFEIGRGETLALVGESGCGKSTVGRMLLRLTEATAGEVVFNGRPILGLPRREMHPLRARMQIVFQDPYGSLNPRKTIRYALRQPFKVHGYDGDIDAAVEKLMAQVGLNPPARYLDRYPHEFSGGQRQRVAIARAFALQPELVVADEPVSALDVSVRAQVLKLMRRLQQDSGVACLFITHDLGVVRSIAQRVAVMYLGQIVEQGTVEAVFANPTHPYTEALLSASPIADPRRARSHRRIILKGDLPSPAAPPSGCRFHTRCPIAQPICAKEAPVAAGVGPQHWATCHLRAPTALSPAA